MVFTSAYHYVYPVSHFEPANGILIPLKIAISINSMVITFDIQIRLNRSDPIEFKSNFLF